MPEPIATTLFLSVVANLIYDIGKFFAPRFGQSNVVLEDDERTAAAYFDWLSHWSNSFMLPGDMASRALHDHYIDIKLIHVSDDVLPPRQTLFHYFNDYTHVHVEAPLGSGKTTLSQHICHRLLTTVPKSAGDTFTCPILVRGRDLSRTQSLYAAIIAFIGKRLVYKNSHTSRSEQDLRTLERDLVMELLKSHNFLLIVDGLDEVPLDAVDSCLEAIDYLCTRTHSSRLITTARTGYLRRHFRASTTLSIPQLSTEQVSQFARKWFPDEQGHGRFIADLQDKPYRDVLARPLSVAYLCIIYRRSGSLPDRAVDVYRRIVAIFLEEWDVSRGLVRQSRYASLTIERREEFIAALAYELYCVMRTSMNRDSVRKAYSAIHDRFGLPSDHADEVMRELVTHTGLLRIDGFDEYAFYHKSLQEYFIATQFRGNPLHVNNYKMWLGFPDECAVAAAMSSQPAAYLASLASAVARESSELTYQLINAVPSFLVRFLQRLRREGVKLQTGDPLVLMSIVLFASWESLPSLGSASGELKRDMTHDLMQLVRDLKAIDEMKELISRGRPNEAGRIVIELHRHRYPVELRSVLPESVVLSGRWLKL